MPVLPVVMGEEELGIGGFVLGGCFLFYFFYFIPVDLEGWKVEKRGGLTCCRLCYLPCGKMWTCCRRQRSLCRCLLRELRVWRRRELGAISICLFFSLVEELEDPLALVVVVVAPLTLVMMEALDAA